MRRCRSYLALLAAVVYFGSVGVSLRGEETAALAKPKPNSPQEPLATTFSLKKTAEFLDGIAVHWTREKKCGTCHTNYPYLMARPLVKEGSTTAQDEVRKFFENRAANWERGQKGDQPRWDAEVVATAASLAINDAQTTGKLHPLSRQALGRMWKVQQADGGFKWLKCDWPPYEHDDYYGALFAALGVGLAPDQYAQSSSAQEGLAKLRKYLTTNPAPDLHHKSVLLWASLKLDGLMTAAERQATIQELLSLQNADGGWGLGDLGAWKRKDGASNDKQTSDGYGTGFVVYILRQAGKPATDPAVQRGIAWLKTHQRESGRWFTRSLHVDNHHYISHAGTCFAVLALASCEPNGK